MDASACGTLPALSAPRTLASLRERFTALRGSGRPLRLLVDVRPEDDRRHHLEGAVAGEVERLPDEHLRLVDACTIADEDAEARAIVRVWMVGEPASQDAVAAACKTAGAWLRPRLVSAGLVSGSMPAGAAAWAAALAAISGGPLRQVARPHAMGDADIVVPEAGVPAIFACLAGAEFTPDRLFVIEDVVEAAIVLVDRLAEGPPAVKDAGDKTAASGRRPPRRGKARQSVDVDSLLLKLLNAVGKKYSGEDREAYLEAEVNSKSSADLAEMLLEHFGEEVSAQTIRRKVDGSHVSKVYAQWSRFRTTAGGDASDRADDLQRNSARMSDRDAQVDEMVRSGVVTKRNRRRR